MHPFGGLRLSHGHKISDALSPEGIGLDQSVKRHFGVEEIWRFDLAFQELIDKSIHFVDLRADIVRSNLLIVADDQRKLFKTPISERWGKQICLNE